MLNKRNFSGVCQYVDIERDEAKDQCHSLFSGFIRLQYLFGAENNLYVNVARKIFAC